MKKRQELYSMIKELGLQEEVQKTFGRNFTQVKNKDLQQTIWNYDCTLIEPAM